MTGYLQPALPVDVRGKSVSQNDLDETGVKPVLLACTMHGRASDPYGPVWSLSVKTPPTRCPGQKLATP